MTMSATPAEIAASAIHSAAPTEAPVRLTGAAVPAAEFDCVSPAT